MITRIEIDGFKTFENFSLDLHPMSALVGPNASGKSNLFDALRLLSLLAQSDLLTAMQDLRGEPEELFRHTSAGTANKISFAIEVLLDRQGEDAFGAQFNIPAQRLRYEVEIGLVSGADGSARSLVVQHEHCRAISKSEDRASYLRGKKISYNARVNPFIRLNDSRDAILVRQDGRQKHGRPLQLSLRGATRTALSTVTTAEFPHLYAMREKLTNIRFLEINPRSARLANDRFESRVLRPDASNLSAVLARLKEETSDQSRPDGVLSDIAADLASLIPSVSKLEVRNDDSQRQYSFSLKFSGDLSFSSRVISDGTLRLLALLTMLNDPARSGTLCFEEPENGVHEGRIEKLVQFLRDAATFEDAKVPPFQILINTHSPKVMASLKDDEIIAADTVSVINPTTKLRIAKTRMRTSVQSSGDLFDPERHLVRSEIEKLLQHPSDSA
jgi:predicted ATPase